VDSLRARPVPARHDQPFWDGLRTRRLLLPYCADCAAFWYPPAPRCPRCLSSSVSWRECAGSGTLWSWATVHRPFAPGLGVPPLRLGLPVTAVYVDDPRGFTVHVFQPAGEAS